jgi:hypothetical protein
MVFAPTAQAAYYFFASNPVVIFVLKKQKNNKLRHAQNKNPRQKNGQKLCNIMWYYGFFLYPLCKHAGAEKIHNQHYV